MYSVDLYSRVRRACHVEGMSKSAAARLFGIDRKTVAKMLAGRRDRWPVASVSFLGAKSNRLLGPDGREPSFEAVLRTMFDAGYRGDVYPSLGMWERAPTGVYASYPFPESLDVMRQGGY